METKVFEMLKPKAASFGFNDNELKIAAKYIAGSLDAEATDEMIEQAIDQFSPILGLSQNASQRIFSRMKAQFGKEHSIPPAQSVEPPIEEPKKGSEDDIPEWFKKYQEQSEKREKELTSRIEQITKEKTNEAFTAKAKAGLKDVDENFYGILMKGKEFTSEEEVNSFVSEVSESWNKLVQSNGFDAQKRITPPSSGSGNDDKPSQAVLDRIAAREKIQTQAPIKGVPQ